jgi:alginate O-acetyltransferase complex protein AlgI
LSFVSVAFLLYFLPVTAAICLALGFSRNMQNAWLFLAGLVFCAWGDPVTAFAMLVSVFVCTALGLAVERAREKGRRLRAVTAAACAFPLGLLLLLRYLPALLPDLPFAASATAVAEGALPFTRPFGIAFFTLQALSYLLDVGRGEARAERNPVSVGLSVAFFPRLLAGPILRCAEFAPQIRERRVTWEAFSEGVCRFAVGFGKAALLAYPLRQAADYVFQTSALQASAGDGAGIPVLLLWMGLAAYALQLYHSFAGCSDMAGGISRMFGFAAKENFDDPYTARSVTDFWRRWHISLSDWFRTYLWSPFGEGADMDGGGRAARRSLIVWLCIGLWYGATATCVFWALWAFFWLTAERVTRLDRRNIPVPLRRLYVLLVVGIGWIFFRAPDMRSAFFYLRDAFGLSQNAFWGGAVLMLLREYWPVLLLGALFAGPLPRLFASAPKRAALAWPAAVLQVLALSAFFLGGFLYLVRAGGTVWM